MNEFQCRALAVRQPSGIFYVSAVKASDLQRICRPLARPSDAGLFGRDTYDQVPLTDDQLNALVASLTSPTFRANTAEVLAEDKTQQPYQRFTDEKRAVEIGRYLEQPTTLLPNSIILAVNIDLDESEVIGKGNGDLFTINLPCSGNAAVILDGQHRVAAFKYVSRATLERYEVVVSFLIGVPFYQQAELFAVINGTQKRVNKSIIYDLFGYAHRDGDKEDQLYEGLMAIYRFGSHVARILDRFEGSPWRSKIKMRGPGDKGVVSQAAVVDYLSALVEPKRVSKRLRIFPLLYSFFKDSDPAGCAAVLILYLSAIRKATPQHWNNADSLLWKNNGVALIFRIFHDDLMLAGSASNLLNMFSAIVERWQKAPNEDLGSPPKTGGGGVQNQLYEKFYNYMFSEQERAALASARANVIEQLVTAQALIK